MVFQPSYSSSGSGVVVATPSSSGCKEGPALDRTPFHHRAARTHLTHSDGDSVDMSLTLCAHLWGMGGSWSTRENLVKSKLHTGSGTERESIFFSHQHYNETTLS